MRRDVWRPSLYLLLPVLCCFGWGIIAMYLAILLCNALAVAGVYIDVQIASSVLMLAVVLSLLVNCFRMSPRWPLGVFEADR